MELKEKKFCKANKEDDIVILLVLFYKLLRLSIIDSEKIIRSRVSVIQSSPKHPVK